MKNNCTIITQEKLNELIQEHTEYLADPINSNNKRLSLRSQTFENLEFKNCDLTSSVFTGGTFIRCEFVNCNLHNSMFLQATFINCNMKHCYMSHCDFTVSVLKKCVFRECNMSRGVFAHSYIKSTTFILCDFTHCDFSDAVFRDMSSDYQDMMSYIPLNCPETGSFIGYKKAVTDPNLDGNYKCVIVKLKITEDAKRTSSFGRKCRCNKAEVMDITTLDGNPVINTIAFSAHDSDFMYTVGKIVTVDNFNTNRYEECALGIHFFITRKEAVDYDMQGILALLYNLKTSNDEDDS